MWRAFPIFLLLLTGCGTNTPPRLVALGNRDVVVHQTLEIIVSAIDPDGDALSFGIRDKPERATFEPTALGARFTWTPIASDVPPGEIAAVYRVTFSVDDGRGGRDGETILITVHRDAPGEGAPVFVTPSDFVLDLEVSDTLDVPVAVQDDDSAEVTFRLLQGPQGAVLSPIGPKAVELSWTPTQAQIAERTLWFLRISADDGVHPPVEQTITVLLRRKGGSCAGSPPVLAHEALPDQQGPGPYRVEAEILDAESTIRSATLFYSTRANPSPADFRSVPLNRDPGAPDLFAANIPDLELPAGTSATVTYFLCASDDDDPSGDACDHVACLPAGQQRFAFVASVGATSCTEDALEPNDAPGAARPLAPGTPLRALRLCGGNDDWFRVNLAAGEILDATLSFTHANGNLDLEAYAPGGTTRLAQSATSAMGVNEEKVQIQAGAAGAYLLRVFAAAGVANTYDLAASVRAGASCQDDGREPNDTAAQAVTLTPGTYSGLEVCAGNDDWYQVMLRAGDNLDVSIDFTHASGDLDLAVYRPDRSTLLGKSDGVVDGERLSFRVVPETGLYPIRVYGYQNAQNRYTLTIGGGTCLDDNLEENDTRTAARTIAPGTIRTLALCAGDEDWYKVSVTAGQNLRVAIRFRHAAGDLDLRILKPDGTNLAGSFSIDDDEVVDFAGVPVTGTYFIQVFGVGQAQNAYDLEVAVTTP
jgi:hypothetical protein